MTDVPTPRLALPLLQPGQAQKEMSHNEALVRLDLTVQASVLGIGAEAPPPDPAPGDCWILGAEPGGAWAGHAHAIAGWTASGWRFAQPATGMRAWDAESGGLAVFAGGAWRTGEAYGRLIVDGLQVVGPQAAPIPDPRGGTTVDAEARAILAAVLAALREHGLVDPG